MSDVEVRHEADRQRYVVDVDGERAGLLDYDLRDDVLVAYHTEVEPRFEGRGVGRRLVETMLDDVRAEGRRVLPLCSFVAAVLRREPQYDDLVAPPTADPPLL